MIFVFVVVPDCWQLKEQKINGARPNERFSNLKKKLKPLTTVRTLSRSPHSYVHGKGIVYMVVWHYLSTNFGFLNHGN
jgi:hypothetical protein